MPIRFIAASIVLAAALIPGAFLRGEVLTQSSLLYAYQPWQPYAPADAAPANTLLSDPALVFYPLLTHAVRTVRDWRLPVWSAAIYGGHPFLASFQTAVFSPFTAIAYVVPLPRATVFMALAPLVVGGVGMLLFIRSLGLTTAAAWFAGIAYLLNGFAVVWMEHPLTAVACWLPWVLRASDCVVKRGEAPAAATLAVLVALVIVSGHPETAAKVLVLAAAYGAAALIIEGTRPWRMIILAYGAGVLLASIQIVPFVEYLAHSQVLRSREASEVNGLFMPAATMITALVPDFFGHPAHGTYFVTRNRFGVAANYAEQALYAGIAVVLLAPAGLISRWREWREWRVPFFAASFVVALALMFGLPGVLHVTSVIPLLRVMMLSRFGVIVIFSLIVLAACGVDRLTRDARGDARRIGRAVLAVALAATAVIGIAWAATRDVLHAHGDPGTTAVACVIAVALLLVVSGVILLRVKNAISAGVFAAASCSLLAVDLLAAGVGVHPTMPAGQVYPPVPEVERIRREAGLFRVYGWGNALVPNAAMAYGLQDVRGWDGMNPHRFTRLLDLGYLRQTSDPGRHLQNPTLLDLLNVRYVFVGGDMSLPPGRYARVQNTRAPLYVNTRAFPRAFLVDRYRVLTDQQLERALHDGSADLARVALLEAELPERERPQGAPTAAGPGTVDVRHYRDTFVELEVNASARALLVMSDAHYPGWVATVDDRPVAIRRANFAVRAISVPAGRHVVRFEYRPLSVRVGALLSAVTGVALLAVFLPTRKRWRHQ